MIPLDLILIMNRRCSTSACPIRQPPSLTKRRVCLHEPHIITSSFSLASSLNLCAFDFFSLEVNWAVQENQIWTEGLHWSSNMKYCMPLLWILLVCIALNVCETYNYVSQNLFDCCIQVTILSIKIIKETFVFNVIWEINITCKYPAFFSCV